MKTRTLYISDLDGTLLNSRSVITPASTRIINNLLDKGMLFTVATARTPATVTTLLEGLKITLPVVLMNGAALYDLQEKKYIQTHGFSDESALRYISILEQNNLIPFVYQTTPLRLNVFHRPLANDRQHSFKSDREGTPYKEFIVIDDYASALSGNPPLFILVIDLFERLQEAAREIEREGNCSLFCYRDVLSPQYGNLEIYPRGVSKATAAQHLIKQINPDETVAFGDNLNDLPLFRIARRQYAPDNATDEIKHYATGIIPDNNHDSVAQFLLKDFDETLSIYR